MIDKTVEWEDYSSDVGIEVMTRKVAITELAPETPPARPYVLLLSSGGGGAFATSGTREELLTLVEQISEWVWALPEQPLPGWDADPEDDEDEDNEDGDDEDENPDTGVVAVVHRGVQYDVDLTPTDQAGPPWQFRS